MGRKPKCAGGGRPAVIENVSTEDICRRIETRCGGKLRLYRGRARSTVIFTPQGTAELYHITGYGMRHPGNEHECQYALYGYYFADAEGYTTTVVCHVLPLQSARRTGSAAAVCADGDTSAWKTLREQEKCFEKYGGSNLDAVRQVPVNPLYADHGPVRRVGFGHTHPGLRCFWSETDRGSVFAAEGEPWVSLVVDPRRMELLAGVGPELAAPVTMIYEYQPVRYTPPHIYAANASGIDWSYGLLRWHGAPSWLPRLLFQSFATGLFASFFVFLMMLGFRT